MRRICILITVLLLALALCIPAFAQGSIQNEGTQSSTLTIKSYDPTKVKFHSYGHMSRWYDSPMANQDPHLWTGLVAFFVVTVGVTGTKLYRSRKVGSRQPSEQETIMDNLRAKEQRLVAKLALVEEKVSNGQMPGNEAKEQQKNYSVELEKVRRRIAQLDHLDRK